MLGQSITLYYATRLIDDAEVAGDKGIFGNVGVVYGIQRTLPVGFNYDMRIGRDIITTPIMREALVRLGELQLDGPFNPRIFKVVFYNIYRQYDFFCWGLEKAKSTKHRILE